MYLARKKVIIAENTLHINQLKAEFASRHRITIDDLHNFYKHFDQTVKRSTIYWRVYELKQKGVLQQVARGIYSLSDVNDYKPLVDPSLKQLFGTIQKQFPYLTVCLWSTKWLNELMTHQPGTFYTIVEVEKEGMYSVFYWLQEKQRHVFMNPGNKEMELYVSGRKQAIIILPLLSEAPIQKVNGVKTVTLEKMLVDIVADDKIFSAQQGREQKRIYRRAYEKYTINQAKLKRYARRRNSKQKVEKLLDAVSKEWQ